MHLPLPACRGLNFSPEYGGRLSRHRFARTLYVLFFAWILGLGFNARAQDQHTEYQIKAAFLFNFAKFVDWPPGAFSATNSPIIIGVFGKNVFGKDLENTIRDKTVNNRRFQFITVASAAEGLKCHILFISPSEKDNLKKILDGLHNASVLTVSETDQFINAGGMINFVIEDNKIRFQISDDAAKKAGLRISSKLLSLAARNH
ncbi:MAG TPA: YfiR family protein [Verrucomicrobiae bacterium]|nr:YfiR family protein [Verrucomicrobiae bacterium]